MWIRLVTQQIVNPLQECWSFLVQASYLGLRRSNPLSHDLPQRLSTVPWLPLLQNWLGFALCSESSNSSCLTFLFFGVTIIRLLLWLLIPFSILELSTLKSTIIMSGAVYFVVIWASNSSLAVITLLIISLSHCLVLPSCFFVANSWLIPPRV